jgi:hypothetical protein
MPTITPVLNNAIDGVPRVIWQGAATGDTFEPFTLKQQYGLAASVQLTGTFGGATITMQVSNDGTNWATARGLDTTDITFTAAGYREFSLCAAYIRPLITGGSGTGLNATMVLRGSHGV